PITKESYVRVKTSTSVVILIGSLILTFGFFGPERWFPADVARDGTILIGYVLCLVSFGTIVWLQYQTTSTREVNNLILLGASAFLTTFQARVFTAELQMVNSVTYTVTTKSEKIEHARVLRSSSSGFILLAHKRILFIPQSEIKEVKSTSRFE